MIDTLFWIPAVIAAVGALVITVGVLSGFIPTCIPGAGLLMNGVAMVFLPSLIAFEIVAGVALALGVLMYLREGVLRVLASAPTAFGVLGLIIVWAVASGAV